MRVPHPDGLRAERSPIDSTLGELSRPALALGHYETTHSGSGLGLRDGTQRSTRELAGPQQSDNTMPYSKLRKLTREVAASWRRIAIERAWNCERACTSTAE